MAATLPKDLKRETWKKIKPLLMKKTALGEALEAYGKKSEAVLKKPSLAGFGELTTELETLKSAVAKAVVAAKAGKHKDCEESLKGYTALIAREAQKIMAEQSTYQKDLDAWIKIRVDCISGMKKHQVEMTTLGSKIEKTLTTFNSMTTTTKTLAPPIIKQATALGNKDLLALETLRKSYKETCDSVRIAKTGGSTLDANDRPTEYLESLNKLSSALEGEYNINKGKLEKGIKAVESLAG